jgi:hypothetical protein
VINALNSGSHGGDKAQAMADVGAGGLGTAAGLMTTFGVAVPGLNAVAAIAGLAASGNKTAQEEGWYGTHDENGKEVNSTFGGSIAETATSVRDAVDIPVIGDIAAGAAGAGQAVWNTGAAAFGGALNAAEAIDNAVLGALGLGQERREKTPDEMALDAKLFNIKMNKMMAKAGLMPDPDSWINIPAAEKDRVNAPGNARDDWEATHRAKYDAAMAKFHEAHSFPGDAAAEAAALAELRAIPN